MNRVLKVLNKQLMIVQTPTGKRLEPNIFEGAKAAVIARHAGALKDHLPCTIGLLDYAYEEAHPDLFRWCELLSPDNSPGRFHAGHDMKRFRELVEPIDFLQPCDGEAVYRIRAEFTAGDRAKPAVDAEDIMIDGEA